MKSCCVAVHARCALSRVVFRKAPVVRYRAAKTTTLEASDVVQRLEKDLRSEIVPDCARQSMDVLELEESLDAEQVKEMTWLERVSKFLLDIVPMSERTRGILLLNIMTFIMATNWVVVKDAGTVIDPIEFTALRFTIAAIAFIPFFRDIRNVKKEVVAAGAELGFWFAMGYLTQALGLMTTDASRASFLSAFTVILVPVLAGLAGRGISIQTWSAAGFALLGTGLLEEGGGAAPGIGDALNLLSAALFAVQVLRTEHFSRKMPGETTNLLATSLGTTAVISCIMAIGLHPSACLDLVQNISTANIPWKEVVYTGVLSTDLVLLIELIALNKVPATDAAIIYTIDPVLGALLAYVVLGERWGPMGWVGATMILISSLGTQLMGMESTDDGIEQGQE